MTSRLRRGLGVSVLTAVLTVSPLAMAQTETPAPPTEEELASARQLFQDAYADEQAGRFDVALDKFYKVARVKESVAVRYRIATCLEGLKRLREARDAFRAIAASREVVAPAERDIAESAAQRAVQLDRRIPRLVVSVAEGSPANVAVRLDGAPVPSRGAVELDPGDHVVQATADGAAPFESKFSVPEAGEHPVLITFADGKAVVPPPDDSPRRPFLGWVLVGVGGALVVAGGVTLAVREGNVSDLEDACPGGQCPASRRSDLESTRDAAQLQGPLGGVLIGAGVVAAGVGAYLLLKPRARQQGATGARSLWVSAGPTRGGSMVAGGIAF
jgi:hypothetical protein